MVGLSKLGVTEAAEQMFRWANWTVVVAGPGLRWISPERRRRKKVRRLDDRGSGRSPRRFEMW